MFCTDCGRPVPDDAMFCTECGGRLMRGSPNTTTPDTQHNNFPPDEPIGARRFVSPGQSLPAASGPGENELPMTKIVLGGLGTVAAIALAAYVIKPSLFVDPPSHIRDISSAAAKSANGAPPLPPPPKKIDLTCEIHLAGHSHIIGRLRFVLDDADKTGMLTAYRLSGEMFSPGNMSDVLGVSAKYWDRTNGQRITVVTPGGYLGWRYEFNRDEGTVRVIQQMGGNWWEGDCDQHTGF